jgi:aminoglycoside phosphotransferase (APT) family kinase protein
LRLNNLIIRDDEIVGLIDSESMKFGDPLFEFVRLSVGGALNNYFIEGCREYRELNIDNESLIYKLYRMKAVFQ